MGDHRNVDEVPQSIDARESVDRTHRGEDQSSADLDQTHADLEQVAAEAGQEASDRDRELSEQDQHASDRDQAVADSEGRYLSGAASDPRAGGDGSGARKGHGNRARRQAGRLTLVMIDVDGLKAVNDNDGHAAGDELLRVVPRAITTSLRSYDVTARWGGDEFVCALHEITEPAARERIEEIRRELTVLQPGASISTGLAELRPDDTVHSLVARADRDLYEDKKAKAPPG